MTIGFRTALDGCDTGRKPGALMRRILDYFRPPPIRDAATLRTFLSGEASYLAQRSTYEFSRNALAWYGQAAFGDPEFNDAFRICRWETYATVLSGFVLLTELRLRPAAGDCTRLDAALLAAFARMLADYPMPAHRPDWSDMLDRLRLRLEATAPDAPPTPIALGAQAAEQVYPTLPVRSGNAVEDRKVIANALTFGTIAFNDRLVARLDAPAVHDDLVPAAIPASTVAR